MSDTRTTPTRTTDPPFTGRFTFQVDRVELGSFMEVSGLSVQVEVEELVEGGQNGYVHRLPGRLKWPNLVLRRGVTKGDALFAWLAKIQSGYSSGRPVKPSNASVVLCGPKGEEVRRWTVEGAYPVKWTGPKLAATSNELALEELEICHRGFRSAS